MRPRARYRYTSSTLIGGKGWLVQVRFTLRLRDQQSIWMQDRCNVCMDSYMASTGSCFMVTHTILKNHLLEGGLTYNRETMTLQTLTTIGLLYYIMCEDPHKYKVIVIASGWGPGHIWLHTILKGLWPHYITLEVSWDSLWALSFGLSQFHGHGSWLVCEVALRLVGSHCISRNAFPRQRVFLLVTWFTMSVE